MPGGPVGWNLKKTVIFMCKKGEFGICLRFARADPVGWKLRKGDIYVILLCQVVFTKKM